MKSAFDKVISEVKGAFGIPAGQGSAEAFPGRERFPLYWESIPAISREQRERECGGETGRYSNLYEYALKRWGNRLPRRPLNALVIGLSHKPEIPRTLLDTGLVKNVLAVDSDAVSLENLLEEGLNGIECWQMDLNCDPLPKGPFDIVICHDALNHLREIDHIGEQVEKVLDRSGLFIAREYVGPNRLQFTEEQMGLVNAFLALIPERLRKAKDMEDPVENQFAPDLADMIRIDPSKAACSENIEKMLLLRFRIMEEIPLGGTIMAPLLANISECFMDISKEDMDILKTLLDVEMRLIKGELIKSDYKAFVARLY